MAESTEGSQPVFIDVSDAPEQYPQGPEGLESVKIVDITSGVKKEAELQKEAVDEADGQTEAKKKRTKTTATGVRFKCTECNRYSAETEEQLERHIRKMHRGQNPFQCYMCDYSTYNKALFEEHVRIHKGIKPFKCSYCPYASASKKNTKKHELIHRPDNPLKCPSCPFIARHVRSFNNHKQQHEKSPGEEMYSDLPKRRSRDSTEFVCMHCGSDFAQLRGLVGHQRNVIKCQECGIFLCSKYLHNRHMVSAHGAPADSGPLSFRCALCPWRGALPARILLHLLHHPRQEPPPHLDLAVLRRHGILP